MSRVRLGEICTFQSGGTPSKNIDEYYHGTIPWITTVALNGNQIDGTNAVEWITDRAIAESAAKIVPVNSIMVGTRVGVGKVAINTVEMSTSQDVISLLNIDDSIWNKDYLCKFIQSKSAYLNAQARGATIKGIKIDVLSGLELPDISVLKQQRISRVLDTVSRLIEKHQTQIALLDEFIKSRFVEIFGTVDNNSFDYPVVRLGEYAKLQGGFAFKSKDFVDNGIPLVQIGNVNKDYLNWEVINSVPNEYVDRYREFSLCDGDLVMAMTRPIIKSLNSVKIAKVSKSDTPCLLNQRVGRFVLSSSLNRLFLETLCKSDDFKDYVERMSGNSLQPNISSKQVEDYLIILPPKTLQNQFADFVTQVEKQKATVQQSIDKLETLKKSLMQEYFG